MRKVLYELLTAVAFIIIVFCMGIGALTIVAEFTVKFENINSDLIGALVMVAILLLGLLIIRRIYNVLHEAYYDIYLFTLDEAHIKNVLHDWSRNKITTKQALQDIDSIYEHHYTDNIRIKDGDKR